MISQLEHKNMKNINYKDILLLLFTLFFFNPLSVQAEPLEKVSLQLQWKHQFEFAGFYAAIEKGYYHEEGLELELKESLPGINPVQDVINGKADFGISYSSLVSDYLQGKPVVLLANIFKHAALVLISQKELDKPSDLIGKTVIGNELSLHNSGITMMLNRFDVSLSDISIVEPVNNIDAFVNKEADALTAFITNEPYQLNQKNIKYNIFSPSNYGAQFYDVNIFTSLDYKNTHSEQIRSFRRASIKGWEYALAHSDEIINLILTKYNTQNKTKEALVYEAEITKSLILPKVYPIGSVDCNILNGMAENFVRLGLANEDSDLKFKEFLFDQSCSKDESVDLTELEGAYLKSKKEIKVCVDPSWMPFESIQNSKHIGMAADYMQIIESRLQTPIKLVMTKTWSNSLEAVKAHQCDILSLAMETPERSQYLNFTKPYLVIPLVIATKVDKFFVTDINEVINEKLGVVKDYSFVEILKEQYPTINLVEVTSIEEGLKLVDKGELFGFIGNVTTIGYQMQKEYFGSLKISGRIGQNWELGVGVRKDDMVLLSILDKAISSINEKTKQKIFNQWVSIKFEQGFNYDLFWKLLAFIAVVFIFILYRYQTLRFYNAKLEKLSTTDPLTNLYNRRYLNKHIKNAYNLANRYSTPFSIILMDIDNFKNVNDSYGHDEGDIVLKKVSSILLKQSRSNDIVGRWGGEEFLIICSHSHSEAATVVAEKVCRTIEKEVLCQNNSITASFGVAEFKHEDKYGQLVINADKALYQAKDEGKNRVVVFN